MNQDETPKRKGGRPQKFPGEGARVSHGLRLKPAVSKALKKAAEMNGRTLSDELERRINLSFDGLYLDLSDKDKEAVVARANENRRSVEEEVSHNLLHIRQSVADLSSLSSKELAEFVRVVVRDAATKSIGRDDLATFRPNNYREDDPSLAERMLDFEEREFFSKLLRWMQMAETYSAMLADAIDPDRRLEEERRIEEHMSRIYHRNDSDVQNIRLSKEISDGGSIIKGYAPGTYPKKSDR